VTSTPAPRRVVVVNLDETWNFAGLVRRGALDAFADPDGTTEVLFRTLGNVDRSTSAAGRLAVWGAERPLIYGDDLDSLTDDLIQDVDDLIEDRIADLAIVVVFDDPDADGATARRPDFLVRLEAEIHERASSLGRPPQRWVCVRDRSGGTEHPRLDDLIDTLTWDPTMTHRQLADHAFRLRASRVGSPDLEVDTRHFLALRTVVAIAIDGFPRRGKIESAMPSAIDDIERSSPVAELIKAHTAFEILLPGAPAPTTSAAIAELLEGHRRAAEAAAPGIQPRLAGEDPTRQKVSAVIATIETSMATPGQDTGSASVDRADLERRTEELASQSRWWSAAGERTLVTLCAEVGRRLDDHLQRRFDEFVDYRRKLESRISTEFDALIRDQIRSIPMVGGGLSGTSAVQLDEILETVVVARRAAERQAEEKRAQFMGVLLPGKSASTIPLEVASSLQLDLGRMEAYAGVVEAQSGLRAIYRGLMPRVYLWATVGLGFAAALTVLAHAAGKAQGAIDRVAEMLQTRSGMLVVAVSLAFAVGFGLLFQRAEHRRRTLRAAVDDLQRLQGDLWSKVVALTDAAFAYVTVSRQILYFRLLEAEVARRRREEDGSALVIAFEDIARRGTAAPLVPAERAAAHAQEMMRHLETLPPVRWIRRMLELPSTFDTACPGPQVLRFALVAGSGGAGSGGASGTFVAASTVFRREQRVDVAVMPVRGSRTVAETAAAEPSEVTP